ncbi:MAG TPA: 23S rRNA (uracil(1939)-C(5))-methyltransferase RlmD [Thiothrix sp.]|nr:23S rRNA (uracil(1939)-C(5))-methyltransferase RlmD [Thiothrix sp.]
MARRRKKLPNTLVTATIESLSHDGRGVTHIDGKTVFIAGALPQEAVSFRYTKQNRDYDEGKVEEVQQASSERVEPRCRYFGLCGGCSLQHLAETQQIHYKQQTLLDNLKHIGKVTPETTFPPLTAKTWAYRRKARLGVKYVAKKQKVLVGFREKHSGYLADMQSCDILHESVGQHLQDLQTLIGELSIKDKVPQIECAIGDNATAMVFRHLAPLTDADCEKLLTYAKAHQIQLYLQPKGVESIHLLYPERAKLFYEHPEFNTKVVFGPNDFFQVNTGINRQMVSRAIELLQLTGTENVLDLFCGLGNFTLPIARFAAQVTGVEGDQVMVNRARQTALANDIHNTHYYACNLMEAAELAQAPWLKQQYDCILLDPPRLGAKEVIPHLKKLEAKRIVYVSCHPATLARDAALLQQQGYHLLAAGVMDMFPHTAHVESIAVFVQKPVK